eukprot:CAMPEP_0201655374 /NCGR_PEP_ID=MMETSP0493-20130528/45976_1 /ASSEMBLY_ACC=CAM_ASM_000838 /TAXON_ID=420259 /ORGANISM="Thalassiosira gravida, Strain GMp14c1" /LENGTH=505 /DNA_ID=CAMNT_0048131961 /DNA_START=73 /DNA_END=1590 /DNA_ORIENTATION=-
MYSLTDHRRQSRRIRPGVEEPSSSSPPKKQQLHHTSSTSASSKSDISFRNNILNHHNHNDALLIHQQLQRKLCPVTGILRDIFADYRINSTRLLGRGHYGIVRECEHRVSTHGRRTLAVKSIEKFKIRCLDHLRREIYLLHKMKHSGIMEMIDCYEDAEFVHIVTEKYSGGELFDVIGKNTTPDGCLSERRSAGIVKSLLEAVAYLHANEIVHRDIKPENILFESNADDEEEDAPIKLIDFGLSRRHKRNEEPMTNPVGTAYYMAPRDIKPENILFESNADDEEEDAPIKLIDFGLSRRHKRNEEPMTNPVGTAYYMAPELLEGKYDKSCDVWSVGTIAYIMQCGYPPFNGETDPDIFDAIRRGRYHFPSRAWSNKSDDVKDFVQCLMMRDVSRRLTAREALGHPWIVKNTTRSSLTLNDDVTAPPRVGNKNAAKQDHQQDIFARIQMLKVRNTTRSSLTLNDDVPAPTYGGNKNAAKQVHQQDIFARIQMLKVTINRFKRMAQH